MLTTFALGPGGSVKFEGAPAVADEGVRATLAISNDEEKSGGRPEAFSAEESIH